MPLAVRYVAGATDRADPADVVDQPPVADEEGFSVWLPDAGLRRGRHQRAVVAAKPHQQCAAGRSQVEWLGLLSLDQVPCQVVKRLRRGIASQLAGDDRDSSIASLGKVVDTHGAIFGEQASRAFSGLHLTDAQTERFAGPDGQVVRERHRGRGRSDIDRLKNLTAFDGIAEHRTVAVQVVAAIGEPVTSQRATRRLVLVDAVEGAVEGPLPGIETRQGIAVNLRHLLATLLLVVRLGEIEEAALPGGSQPHAVQVVAEGDLVRQPEGEAIVDAVAQL